MTKLIDLTQNKCALVDNEDFERVNNYKWCFDGRYACRRDNLHHKKVYLHRFLTDFPIKNVDHINQDKLDNRKANLRLATKSENQMNLRKNKYKGVCLLKRDKFWKSQITLNYKTIFIGNFKEERWAAMAYDIWAKELFGEFAQLNFKSI